jgi:hypothetical protein
LIQKSICGDFPELDSSFFGLELNVEYSIAFGSKRDGVIIDKLEVVIRSQFKLSCSRNASFIFKTD